jgi:hypothetical protein
MRTRTGYKQKSRHKLTDEERDAVRQWVSLRKVTPQDWLDRVNALPERARGQIARMIWWDFWSEKLVANRWTEFDHWLQFDSREETDPVPREMIVECLKAVGYPDYRIKLRLMAF